MSGDASQTTPIDKLLEVTDADARAQGFADRQHYMEALRTEVVPEVPCSSCKQLGRCMAFNRCMGMEFG